MELSSYYLSPCCPSILSHKQQDTTANTTKSLANITSSYNSIPDLNLTGEQMCIRENIMKVVNFESVITNLEEHLRNNPGAET